MRSPSIALPFLGLLVSVVPALAGCSVDVRETGPATSEPPPLVATASPPPPAKTPAETPVAPPPPAPVADSHAEVVHVYMRDTLRGMWFCTGTLVASDIVVTAAHCLDTDKFVSYEIVAPMAPGKPRVNASKPAFFGGHYDDVANPDFGILRLDAPVTLPRYAELTDVTGSVDAGTTVLASAVIRTAQDPRAPFAPSASVPVSSTVQFGYEHGFGTPLFTKGGDSGAGLFLVENGKVTHKLIGVARQPEPARSLDHFTRVDGELLTWFTATATSGD